MTLNITMICTIIDLLLKWPIDSYNRQLIKAHRNNKKYSFLLFIITDI